jgi:hypothetical protein
VRRMGDWWIDRTLYEVEPDKYVFQWSYHDTTSWKSLGAQEQAVLEGKAAALTAASLDIWEKRGRDLLSMLVSATDMQPFAEDLGAVPPVSPRCCGRWNTRASVLAGSGDGRAPASPIFRSKCMSLVGRLHLCPRLDEHTSVVGGRGRPAAALGHVY